MTTGKPTGNFWILDEADGWIYWATAIAPGESTSNILESVKLDVMPGASFEYYIHIDMEAVTYDDLDKWVTNGTSINGEDLIDNLILDANIVVGSDGTKYLKTDIVNVYEVLNDDRTSQSPKVYIHDLDGSIASNGETNGDEYACDVAGNIIIDSTLFPDSVLMDAILNGYTSPNGTVMAAVDADSDGKLSVDEINSVTSIVVQGESKANRGSLYDISGIELFSNLEILNVEYQNLTDIDVSQNTDLIALYLNSNNLTAIDLSNNLALTSLSIGSNYLTSIDLSENINLQELRVGTNQLTSIDLSNNINLTYITIHSNQLSSLDISNNTKLETITCQDNQLTALDVSNNTVLSALYCYSNQIISLDVSNNTALTDLRVNSNQLTSLNVSNNTALTNLQVHNNQLTVLDVSNNTALTNLQCNGNQITTLDISMLNFLYNSNTLRIQNNDMQSLIVPSTGSTLTQWNTKTSNNLTYHWTGNDNMVISQP